MDQAVPAHQALHLRHVTTGLRTVWHLEKTARPSTKMLGGAGHHEHRALLMLGVLRRIGQHGWRYDPSTVKRRERG